MISAACVAQPTRRAQKKMDLFNYSRAINILNNAVKRQKYHDNAVIMLAECYRRQRDFANERIWYEQAIALPGAKAEMFFYYAQALCSAGEYSKAKQMFIKYSQMNPADVRGTTYAVQCELIMNDWNNLSAGYEVKTIPSINSTASDFGPAFYANGFTFASDRGKTLIDEEDYGWTGRNYIKLLFAKPENTGDFFGNFRTPALLNKKFNLSYHDGPAIFAGDSLAMFTRTTRDRKSKKIGNIKTNLLKIYFAERKIGNWDKPKPFFLNSREYSIGHPALSPDGKILYFASDMPGGQGGVDIWMCNRLGKGWSTPINLGPTVNTSENEMFPSVHQDGTLYFASDGIPGYGGLDIFSTRKEGNGWTTPKNLLSPINSSYDDFAIAWIPGTNYGMFSSDRLGGLGSDDIYAFKKLPEKEAEKKFPHIVSGYVKDKTTGQPFAGATVFMLNENSDSVYVLKTNPDGLYTVTLDNTAPLIVKATGIGYIPDCEPWPVAQLVEGSENKAPRDLILTKLEINKTIKLENIYYNYDESDIRPDAEPALDNLVRIMKDNPITIELSSHTDCRGSFAYNDKLSTDRAEAVSRYIQSQGIDVNRIIAKGFGEHQLTNRCADGIQCSEAEHQSNRRTEFKVLSFNTDVNSNSGFNPGKFLKGDHLLRNLLPADFFMQCK